MHVVARKNAIPQQFRFRFGVLWQLDLVTFVVAAATVGGIFMHGAVGGILLIA
jgi:uncharacterized integral membrane protein